MSYTSTSVLNASVSVAQVEAIIDLLGYKKARDVSRIPNRVASYMWYDAENYRSWSGVELDIFKSKQGRVEVSTRSRSSRSHWDLTHQNRTLKLLKDLFGGYFKTDAGRNRYWRPEQPAPSPLASGCYLARWRFHNSLQRASVYLMHRRLEGQIAQDSLSGFTFIDDINPRLLSNNLIVPYAIAVWEEYFRATFTACLRYSKQREAALKKARLSHEHLERLVAGKAPIDRTIADAFSFQRPSAICEAFTLIDPKLDLASALRKPYRNRRQSLYSSIEALVGDRNRLVHAGEINVGLFDKRLRSLLSDLTAAVDRAYSHIAKHNGFTPNHDY